MFYEFEGWGWYGFVEEGLWWEMRGYYNGYILLL